MSTVKIKWKTRSTIKVNIVRNAIPKKPEDLYLKIDVDTKRKKVTHFRVVQYTLVNPIVLLTMLRAESMNYAK